MEFRIVEVKKKYQRVVFIPEYKDGWFWRKVSSSEWSGTIMCGYEFDEFTGGLYSKREALNCLDSFKGWLDHIKEVRTVHNVGKVGEHGY